MKRGFSVPVVLMFVVLFISIPLIFWVLMNRSSADNVRGTSSKNATPTPAGISIKLNSLNGTWDLYQYLCTTKEECSSSLYSGKRAQVISGGPATGYEVFIPVTAEWNSYKYSKVYVRSGWGTQYRTFNVVSTGEIPDTEVLNIKNESNEYKVIIFPITETVNTFYKSAEFSDQ